MDHDVKNAEQRMAVMQPGAARRLRLPGAAWGVVLALLLTPVAAPVRAETPPAPKTKVVPLVVAGDHAATDTTADGEVNLVARRRHRSSGTTDYPLKGDVAWIVAGSAGALTALILHALFWCWWGFIGPFFIPLWVVATIWAFFAVGLGGFVAWLVSAAFSEKRSGFLIPVGVSAFIGAGITAAAGLIATGIWLLAMLVGGMVGYGPYYYDERRPWAHYRGSFAWGVWTVAAIAAFAVWFVGVIAASIVGPFVGAYIYRWLGIYRGDKEIHFDVMTPGQSCGG